MTTRQGICTNAGRCRLADVKTVQEIGADDSFTCRLCGLPLAASGGSAPGVRSPGPSAPGAGASGASAPVAGAAAPGMPASRSPGAGAPGVRPPGPVAAGVAPAARTTGTGTPGAGAPPARPAGPVAGSAGAPPARAPGPIAGSAGAPAARAPGKDAPGAEKAVRPPAAAPTGGAVRSPPAGAGAPAAGARGAAADVSSRFPLGASLGVLVFVVMAVFAFFLARGGAPPRQPERAGVSPPPSVQPAPAAASVQPAPAAASAQPGPAAASVQPGPGSAAVQVILRLAGSHTVGAQLAPALAQGYLASIGATDVQVSIPGSADASVQGTKDGARQAIAVSARGSATAFEALLAGTADIGLSSRRVKPEEAQRLAALGSMSSPANEHVVALDGIAVIVSKANPIAQLSREQLAAVFAGRVSDWSQLKGQAGPIHAYSPDDKSGTADLFQTLVLGRTPIAAAVKRLPNNQAVADAVVGDPAGIGLVGLPFVRGAKALAVAEGDAAPMIPNAFTLANEDYFLARRLYLYTDQASKNQHVSRFVEFALGPEGQAIVKKAGFVELTVKAEPRPPPDGAPVGYVRLTTGSRRLSTDFRFVAGSSRLDNRAMRDLDRVVEFLRDNELNGASVRLLGFADSHGGAAVNLALSRERAVRVARAFAQRGITGATIAGFGAAIPVADNSSEIGRERNRRVEIWITR